MKWNNTCSFLGFQLVTGLRKFGQLNWLILGGTPFLHIIQLTRRNAVPDSSTTFGGIFWEKIQPYSSTTSPSYKLTPLHNRMVFTLG